MSEFYIEVNKIRKKDRTDRYKDCMMLKDVDTGEVLLSTREIKEIPVRSSDRYHRVMSHEGERLDLIAHEYYKNPLLWWVLAQANNIYNPLENIAPGTLLRIPSLESLYGNNGILL